MRAALKCCLGGVAGVALALAVVLLFGRPPRLPERPVFHVFGAIVTVAIPGQKDQAYYRWCDPDTGYLMYANGFAESSPLTLVKDARCDGAH